MPFGARRHLLVRALFQAVKNVSLIHENAHLRMIEGLKQRYPKTLIGYSDHTLPDDLMAPLVTAFSMGAVIIEKHFTLDRTLKGPDHRPHIWALRAP